MPRRWPNAMAAGAHATPRAFARKFASRFRHPDRCSTGARLQDFRLILKSTLSVVEAILAEDLLRYRLNELSRCWRLKRVECYEVG